MLTVQWDKGYDEGLMWCQGNPGEQQEALDGAEEEPGCIEHH